MGTETVTGRGQSGGAGDKDTELKEWSGGWGALGEELCPALKLLQMTLLKKKVPKAIMFILGN